MDLSKLSDILKTEPKFRFQQVYQALYKEFVSDWNQVSVLPLNLRRILNQECPLDIKAEIFIEKNDKSLKALLTFNDHISVETVLMRNHNNRYTVCLSSQAGCPVGCAFCATGQNGFFRNLSADEIIQQFIFWARYLKKENKGGAINNVVFMGMGEPFLNYDNFIKAVKILNNSEKFNFGSRRISVSTVGIVEGIKKLSSEKLQINLAISLHAAIDSLRQQLIPIATKYSINNILRAVDEYISKTGRKVMFEYIMIKNVNDGEDDALALAKLMKKPLYLVNLIPYNPTGKFQSSSSIKIREFQQKLESFGVVVTKRYSQGQKINAACGQLIGKKK